MPVLTVTLRDVRVIVITNVATIMLLFVRVVNAIVNAPQVKIDSCERSVLAILFN